MMSNPPRKRHATQSAERRAVYPQYHLAEIVSAPRTGTTVRHPLHGMYDIKISVDAIGAASRPYTDLIAATRRRRLLSSRCRVEVGTTIDWRSARQLFAPQRFLVDCLLIVYNRVEFLCNKSLVAAFLNQREAGDTLCRTSTSTS